MSLCPEETETQGGQPDLCPSTCPSGVACSVILMYTFCTDCWLIAVLYFTWLVFDWNTPKKGKGTARVSLPYPRPGTLPLTQAEVPHCGCCLFLLNTYYVRHTGLGQGVVLSEELKAPPTAPSWSS